MSYHSRTSRALHLRLQIQQARQHFILRKEEGGQQDVFVTTFNNPLI